MDCFWPVPPLHPPRLLMAFTSKVCETECARWPRLARKGEGQASRIAGRTRKAGKSSTRPELNILISATDYVALFEIASPSIVLLLALRRQRSEADLQRR